MGYSTRMTQMTSDIRRYSVQSLDRLSRGLESTVLSTLCKLERDVNDAAKHMATLTEAAIGRVESGAGTAAGALGDIKVRKLATWRVGGPTGASLLIGS